MATKIIMPKQGLQMTEGTIISWLVKEGGKAIKDEPLFEMETDKLTITIDSPESGTLLKIVKDEGETVPITETIAIVGEQGEDISGLLDGAAEEKAEEEKPAPQAAGQKPEADKAPASGSRIFISPRAKMLAQDNGVNIADLGASGPGGLITEKDVAAYIEKKGAMPEVGTPEGGRLIPISGMRKAIAKKMMESLSNTAQATVQVQVDISECVRIRESFKNAGKNISYNDLVMKAACKALNDFPDVNSEWTEEGILQKDYVNMGIAVAIETGLIVPVIRNAHLKDIEQIAQEAGALTEKAKNGLLKPDEYTGGSFTVSNMGMYKIDSFIAILNPPETGILAVGGIKKTPVVVDDKIEVRSVMSITLTYDHRVVDGATAARFTAKVRDYLENP